MLNQLDILIGFAVVMAVVSLLITLITQMVSAALGLRGKYLADALEAMIHKIDPTIGEDLHGLGKDLARWILTHPVLSDSLLLSRPMFWDNWPIIGWIRERWKTASAIRSDELFQVLQDVAGTTPEKALNRLQELRAIAGKAWAAVSHDGNKSKDDEANRAKRASLAEELKEQAREKRDQEQKAMEQAQAAVEAPPSPAIEQQTAGKFDWVQALQSATKQRIQAVEIADKAGASVDDLKSAKRFANEMSMRAAAANVLFRLYRRPEASESASPAIDLSAIQKLINK